MTTLKSDYDFDLKLPPENIRGFHQYVLEKAAEAVASGRTDWLTDARNGKTYTFSDVEDFSRRIASALYKMGLRKGQTVIYTSHDCSLLYFVILGILRANGIVRAVYSEETTETILEKIEESSAKWIICDGHTAKSLLSNPRSFEILVFSEELIEGTIPIQKLLEDSGDALPNVEIDRDDIALILPTSGTTGASKGAATSHKAMLYRARIVELQPFTEDPSNPLMLFGKPTHASGAALVFYQLINAQRVITSPYSKEMLFRACHEFKCESIFCVAPLLTPIVYDEESTKYDLTSLKHIFMGGAMAKPEFVDDLLRIPSVKTVSNNMGMTESSILSTSSLLNNRNEVLVWEGCPPGSIGKLIPGAELQVRDTDTGKCLGPGERGELCYKLDWAFSYYLNNPKDTKETLKDGWLITGDYGYFDERGFIFILDRIKDTFLCHNGNHISPSQIEAILKRHPSVKEACVTPDLPNVQVGHPRGFVILKEGQEKSPELAHGILDFANSELAEYQHLTGGLFILDSFPVGKTGKVQRRLLNSVLKDDKL